MVRLVVVARRDALAEVAAHHLLIVLAPCGAACVEARVWDEPAIRLPSETLDARGLSPGDPAQLHVPLDPRAVTEARALRHALASRRHLST